jgi:NTP pyrophosphatase (non-canonical NTP hydrolase)
MTVGSNPISALIYACHRNAREKGFWDTYEGSEEQVASRIMLIVTELAEAVEALRHGDLENFHEELADTAIRLFDLCGGLNVDLAGAIERKMAVNAERPRLHGKGF